MRWSIKVFLLILVQCLGAANHGVVEVREYKNASLLELSKDGKLILTRGDRILDCRGKPWTCPQQMLAVYETSTGRLVGQQIGHEDAFAHFYFGGFLEDGAVIAGESWFDVKLKKSMNTWIRWEPSSGTSSDLPLPDPDPERSEAKCPLDRERFLTLRYEAAKPGQDVLEMVDGSGPHPLLHPPLSRFRYDFPGGVSILFCRAWRAGASFLVQAAGQSRTLNWISTRSDEPARTCRAFPDERVHGYSVSPDGSMVAVVTSVGEFPGGAYRVYLNVLRGLECAPLRRVELLFPEKAKWSAPLLRPDRKFRDNIPFGPLFAQRLAISPDNKTLAVAYGIQRDPDGLAFFGLYSISDGHRLATVAGDVYKCGILHGALLNDELHCQTAPIQGELQFSPDSQTLFATSKTLHQWNVSALSAP